MKLKHHVGILLILVLCGCTKLQVKQLPGVTYTTVDKDDSDYIVSFTGGRYIGEENLKSYLIFRQLNNQFYVGAPTYSAQSHQYQLNNIYAELSVYQGYCYVGLREPKNPEKPMQLIGRFKLSSDTTIKWFYPLGKDQDLTIYSKSSLQRVVSELISFSYWGEANLEFPFAFQDAFKKSQVLAFVDNCRGAQ